MGGLGRKVARTGSNQSMFICYSYRIVKDETTKNEEVRKSGQLRTFWGNSLESDVSRM